MLAMNVRNLRQSLSLFAISVLVGGVNAAPVIYSGGDIGAGPVDARPNADGAAAAFDLAAGTLGETVTIDFESAPLGSFTSLPIGLPTITGQDYSGSDQTILDSPAYPDPDYFSVDGYNTTVGGAKFLEMLGGTMTFSFSSPISMFGAYFTGVQQPFFGSVTLNFEDGASQIIPFESLDAYGGVQFIGFIDEGALISSVTVKAISDEGFDFLGIDDVRFGPTQIGVPTPETGNGGVLLALASLGCFLRARRVRTN
jgi:hypothetical protein